MSNHYKAYCKHYQAYRNINRYTIRSNIQTIDYLALNDGLDDDMPVSPKHRRKNSHRPRGKVSTTRQAAHKHATPTEPKTLPKTKISSALPAVPSPNKTKDKLPGIPSEQTLPDLMLEQGETTYPETTHAADTTGTEEELSLPPPS